MTPRPEGRPEGEAPPPPPPRRGGWTFVWFGVALGLLAMALIPNTSTPVESELSAIRKSLRAGEVLELIVIPGARRIEGHMRGAQVTERGQFFESGVPTEDILTAICEEVEAWNRGNPERPVDMKIVPEGNVYLLALMQMLPWLLVGGFLVWYLWRQSRNMGGNIAGQFGKSRSREVRGELPHVTFDDVAGIHEAKDEVFEIIEFLREPARFRRLGGRIPRGVLLCGAPGTGKTLLAKAVAGEAEVPFFSICGSDFVEMFVGVGASRVRDLFAQARENSPSIIFLDEIDAVGRRRGASAQGGSEEREQTLNAILVEMDGFDSESGVIVIAATNRPDVLDPALLRPGRFDREIVIDLPDRKGRAEILEVHTREVPLEPDVELERLARGTPTFSGAELEALVNEAALIAARAGHKRVGPAHFEEARDKVRWGRARKSMEVEEDDRRVTAYHEAGHAILAHLIPDAEPLHKVTIIPRGPSMGSTMQLPERDRHQMCRIAAISHLMVLFGGRIAERRFCGDYSSGASNDLERATGLARTMVCEWGMSEQIGPLVYGKEGLELPLSEETAQQIDREIRATIEEAYQAAETLIDEHEDKVVAIAEALLSRETLTVEEVEELICTGSPC